MLRSGTKGTILSQNTEANFGNHAIVPIRRFQHKAYFQCCVRERFRQQTLPYWKDSSGSRIRIRASVYKLFCSEESREEGGPSKLMFLMAHAWRKGFSPIYIYGLYMAFYIIY